VSLLTHPVAQLLTGATFVLAVTVVATGELGVRAAQAEAVADAHATTEVLARSVAEPAIPVGLVDGRPGAIDRFDRVALHRLLVDDVERIKLWDSRGRVVYSDEVGLIGQSYGLGRAEQAVLAAGITDAAVSDLGRPENRFEVASAASGGLLEVYTRITSPEGEPLLFEVYYSADDLEARTQDIVGSFRPITLGGLLLMLTLTTPLVWVLVRRLRRAGEDRERLLRAAVEASEAERRRIARDLHDTVVQDLAGSSFRLAAAPRDPVAVEEASASIRSSLRSLRSLLVEIYPPDLSVQSLPGAIEDLLAPAADAGIATTVSVAPLTKVSSPVVGLLWRVAQEAVRNAVRHAAPRRIAVRVRQHPGRSGTGAGTVTLQVVDDGTGFDPRVRRERDRLGLRGLHDLIQEHGGRLDVDSTPGEGTTVTLEMPPR
jgi:signal transduction histidine kinase